MRTSAVVAVLTIWFVAAAGAVAAGLLARIPAPPPVIVAALATLTVSAGLLHQGLRTWLEGVSLRVLYLPHLVRFVGVAFLLLVSRGVLVREFAVVGWGDTIAAAGAVALLLSNPRLTTTAGWWSVLVWNCIGFADMVVLVITGIRLGSAAPEQFGLFRQLPFGLLPTFFVPLLISSHVFIFRRLFARRSADPR